MSHSPSCGHFRLTVSEDRIAEQQQQAGTLTPVLLWLFSSHMSDEQRKKAVRALESYLVRRMVCRMTTKNYNQLFLRLVNTLENEGAGNADDTIIGYVID